MQHMNTDLYQKLEAYINAYRDEHGVAPIIRDFTRDLGMPRSTVGKYLLRMEALGLIAYDEHHHVLTRQMQQDITNYTRSALLPGGQVGAPIAGTVGCGEPREAEECIEETVRLPKSVFGDGPLFLLHASGDSMVDAGIEDGDLVVIKQQQFACPGQIVVALVDGGCTTLKRYFPEPEQKRIRLQPENRTMEPMYFPLSAVNIQGVAVKVIKNI